MVEFRVGGLVDNLEFNKYVDCIGFFFDSAYAIYFVHVLILQVPISRVLPTNGLVPIRCSERTICKGVFRIRNDSKEGQNETIFKMDFEGGWIQNPIFTLRILIPIPYKNPRIFRVKFVHYGSGSGNYPSQHLLGYMYD